MNLELDRALLDGYRRGDPRVLDALYRHYSTPVLRSLSRGFRVRGGTAQVSPLDLDAAHQETFVRLFGLSARQSYDGLRPFEPWLMRIARSAAVDVLRAQGKLHREAIALDDLEGDEPLADLDASPEQLALRAEAEAVVQGFLASLSETDRAFATARFIEGLSQEKAGARCGLSRQEARTREAKLKAACLAHLGKHGLFDPATDATRAMVATLVLQLFFTG
jgi:RNA polymerase sigma-70 factor, ECF subfamily